MRTRRQFLVDGSKALLGVGVASLAQAEASWAQQGPGGSAATSRRGAARNTPDTFPTLNFITSDPAYSDYRPAIDSAGRRIVFERTPKGSGLTSMYITTFAEAAAQPFVQPSELFTGPSQTRPDWSWQTGQVAMNVAEGDNKAVSILITDANGNPLANVPDSKGYVYPTWSPLGTQLIVFNGSAKAKPNPCTSLINLDGTVFEANLDGHDANDVPMYGGFATPTPGNAKLIAYAGQPDQVWGAAITGYSQDYNYVFLNSDNGGVYTSAPLESDASIATFDPTHQGRAPVWSPDGKYVAFESDRAGGYAIFLAKIGENSAPVQLTNSHYGAQHAKFFPDGSKIILTCLQKPGKAGPRGIAWIDISQYL